jgi:hypothetical protein
MAEGRSPSVTVLWQRQCLAYRRDSNFAVFGAQWMKVLRYDITYQEVMAHIDIGDGNLTSEQDTVRADRVELSQAF